MMPGNAMTQPAGRRLGRFELLSLLGRGGMGEVYRARDTRLGRDVALKIIAPAAEGDRAAILRFEQEARSASALNHPNIVTVYDVGEDGGSSFIVTELLEGQTLRERLSSGRITQAEAIDIAVNAAAGLAVAHAAGITHRDVKPENIFLVGSRRQVKILDFGVARLAAEAAAPSTTADTKTALATSVGALVGTPGYLAPEQVTGEPVDTRADIFSLGCVLYEMLSGARPFDRNTTVEMLAAIVSEPPPRELLSKLPPPLARVVDRALEKDPADRFQTMQDFAFALRNASEVAGSAAPPRRRTGKIWRWATGLAIAAAAFTAAVLLMQPAPAGDAFELRATVVVPAAARPISPVLSPDGSWVAYIGLSQADPDVYVQFLNGSPPVNLTRGQGLVVQRRTLVGRLDLSRDGRFVIVPGPAITRGLFQLSGIWSVPAPAGGPPSRLTDKYASLVVSSDGRQYAGVIANPLQGDGIGIMAVDGSTSERVILQMTGGEHVHQLAWSPDDRYIYYVGTLTPNHPRGDIYRIPAGGGTPEMVVRTPGTAMFPSPTPDGKAIVYAGNHQGEGMNIWWHPLNGSPPRRLTIGSGEYTEPSVSRDGRSLVCLASQRRDGLIRVSADATDAAPEPLALGGHGDTQPSLSLDGKRVYVNSSRAGDRRIWSVGLNGEGAMPLTTGGQGDDRPVVSPDGTKVAFISSRGGRRGIWMVAAAGGTPRLVTHADVIDPPSWAPDSRRVVYAVGGMGRTELRILDIESGQSTAVPGAVGRIPAWAPNQELIAVVRSTDGVAMAHFISPAGVEAREPIPIPMVGSPLTMALSPDGHRLAMLNLPGRGFAEAWVLDVRSGQVRRVISLPAPNIIDGVAWTPDQKSLVMGRAEFENEVLLIEGLPQR